MNDTQPDALRRFRASLTGHALTTSEKAAVLIVLDKCADEMERLLASEAKASAVAEVAISIMDVNDPLNAKRLRKMLEAPPMPYNA